MEKKKQWLCCNMLKKLIFKNYRCFENFELSVRNIAILLRLQTIIDPNYQTPIDHIPAVSLGGWSRFDEALGAARLFHEKTKGDIQAYCILDRDYHTEEEISNLYKKAKESHLELHVWNKKEIENYLIVPKAIFRMIGLGEEKWSQFYDEFMEVVSHLYDKTHASTMDYLSSLDRSKIASESMKKATEILDKPWESLEGRISVVNGKDLLSTVNIWLKEKYNVNSSRDKLIKALTPEDISQEIKDVIKRLTY